MSKRHIEDINPLVIRYLNKYHGPLRRVELEGDKHEGCYPLGGQYWGIDYHIWKWFSDKDSGWDSYGLEHNPSLSGEMAFQFLAVIRANKTQVQVQERLGDLLVTSTPKGFNLNDTWVDVTDRL